MKLSFTILLLLVPTLVRGQVSRFSAYGGRTSETSTAEENKSGDGGGGAEAFVNSPILGNPKTASGGGQRRRQNRASGSIGLPENVVSGIESH